MGVRKTMVVVEAPERRRSGTDAERKRISSVTGPWEERGEVRMKGQDKKGRAGLEEHELRRGFASLTSC